MPASLTKNQLRHLTCFALAIITLLVYAPMLGHGFATYDDPEYITDNPHVNTGLNWREIAWAFQNSQSANWHPLTWISHMTDCQLFGLNPTGHHLMNLAFHIANTLLLFLFLNRTTGALWRSAFVAALFALHPMHVESVAWASERKDVLSGFFWMLTLNVYSRYAEKRSASNYVLALLFFACGLLSKPMVVTLPFVLLLLDFWPLNRIGFGEKNFSGSAMILTAEKIPFFLFSLASCLITYHVQDEAMWSSNSLPLQFRIENAFISYLRYISKIFWPTGLSLIYPYPHHWPSGEFFTAAVLLVSMSAIFVLQTKRFPYLAVGWFWFLGALVPAIGLVQVGVQSMADRYTYLPAIGLFILTAWGMNDLLHSQPQRKVILTVAATATLIACIVATSIQLKYWRSTFELWEHAVQVTTDNYAADDFLGRALENTGRKKEAEECYAEAVRIEPDYPLAQFDLGLILLADGQSKEASNHLMTAAQLLPRNPIVQYDAGIFLLQHGRPEEAANFFADALKAKSDFAEARQQLNNISTNANTPANRSTP